MVSDCCGADDKPTSLDGPSFSDIGICPDCLEHCEFVEETTEGEEPLSLCENLTKGKWVHVEGWNKASVFEFQKFDGKYAVLLTPKTRKEYRTTNRLLNTRKNAWKNP